MINRTTMKPIQLDGRNGGGQMLRTALSLSMITGQPFRVVNIRGKRKKPGLMRQHLTCVKAACAISDGIADGAELHSTELVFRAGKLTGGNYDFAIGTAGSTGLLFQTLLPALLHADTHSELTIKGGTHNPYAPPFEFLDRVFLPALKRMGGTASLQLIETGFAPAGGGEISAQIEPCTEWKPLDWQTRGKLTGSKIRIPYRNLKSSIAERTLVAAVGHFPCEDAEIEPREPGPGQGMTCLVEAHFENATELSSEFAMRGTNAETVGKRAAKAMDTFSGCDVPVGCHLADQLLLPMALAGSGRFLTMNIDDHVPTNISVIEAFLPVKFEIQPHEGGRNTIVCTPNTI